MRESASRAALRLALLFVLISGLWVLFSDLLVSYPTTDPALLTRMQTVKGGAFIAATGVLLFLLFRRELRNLERRDTQIRDIEQHLRLQSAALESAANAVVITDREGRITWVNPAFTRLTGYTAAEAIGKNPRLLKSDRHDAAFYRTLWETILCGRVWRGELVNRRKDGSLYLEEQTITPVLDAGGAISHFIGIKQDISERKQAEGALRESEEKFRSLVESTSDWVWEIDERNRYTYVSPRIRDILGYAPEEVLGKTPFDLMPAEEARRAAEAFAPITGQMRPFLLFDNVNLHKDGHRVVLETSGTPIFDSQGVLRGYRGIDRDITERKRAEEELRARTQQLEAVRAVSAEITHELDLRNLLQLVDRRAAELVGAERGAILLWDEAHQRLVPQAWHGYGPWVGDVRPRLGEGVAGLVGERREGLIVNDYRNSPHAHPLFLERSLDAAVLCEPLLYRDRLLGVILLAGSPSHRQFSSEDQQLLRLFAVQAAIAIENARLHSAALRRGEELEALLRATRAVMSDLDLQSILERIVAEASQMTGTPHVTVMLVDRAAKVLRVAALIGDPVPTDFAIPLGQDLSGLVAETGQPFFSADSPNDPRNLLAARDRERGFVTYLGLPIRVRDEVLGVLTFDTTTPRRYTPDEVAYLESFAAQAAIAMEKARLYQEIRRHAATLEQRVRDRTREFEEARAQAEGASRHKSDLLANMSHELRTPLNSIIGFSQLLRDQYAGPLSEKQVRYLGHIHSAGMHLFELISDILDLAKVEAGKLIPRCEALPVAATLEDICAIADALAREKSQTLEFQVAPALPPLQADPVRFKQICLNLLSNAVKFTPNGGRITLTARRVARQSGDLATRQSGASPDRPIAQVPECQAGAEWLEIRVQDTGIGIKAEDLPRLFQEFTQLEQAATREHKGTGLGLALTKRLVELHGGRIWAESEGESRGSAFIVLLPFEGPAA